MTLVVNFLVGYNIIKRVGLGGLLSMLASKNVKKDQNTETDPILNYLDQV